MITGSQGRPALSGLSWSGAYLVISRLSTVAAVPLILINLGERLYTAWVLAGTLVMAQGLVDIGMTAATVRFVALAKVQHARTAVISVLRRSLAFYLALSVAVGGLVIALTDPLIAAVPALDEPSAAADAGRLVIYAATAFGITNFIAVAGAALQGLDRVAEAYRAQSLGWLLYVPVLAVTLNSGAGVDALGVAWLVAYGAQALLLAIALPQAIKSTATTGELAVSNRDLLRLGAGWQASSWADFASLQLPRIVAGLTLSSSAVVQLDLAMRGAQLAVAPFFALLPLVLPAASREWGAGGKQGLAAVVAGWDRVFSRALALTTAACLPLIIPAIAVWSSRSVDDLDVVLVGCVLAGTAAHTATGVMTSALLAIGDIRPIMRYKAAQVALSIVLMPVGAALGLVQLGVAILVAMALPAADFMRRARRDLGSTDGAPRAPGRILAAGAVIAIPGVVVLAAVPDDAPAWIALLLVCAGVLVGAAIGVPLSGLRAALRRLQRHSPQAAT